MRLQPWGRIEGTCWLDGEPTTGQELLLKYGEWDPPGIGANFDAYSLTTGPDGHFAFAQVPPGLHQLVHRIEASGWPAGHDGKV